MLRLIISIAALWASPSLAQPYVFDPSNLLDYSLEIERLTEIGLMKDGCASAGVIIDNEALSAAVEALAIAAMQNGMREEVSIKLVELATRREREKIEAEVASIDVADQAQVDAFAEVIVDRCFAFADDRRNEGIVRFDEDFFPE